MESKVSVCLVQMLCSLFMAIQCILYTNIAISIVRLFFSFRSAKTNSKQIPIDFNFFSNRYMFEYGNFMFVGQLQYIYETFSFYSLWLWPTNFKLYIKFPVLFGKYKNPGKYKRKFFLLVEFHNDEKIKKTAQFILVVF